MPDTQARAATGGEIHGSSDDGGDPFDPDDPGPYRVHGVALPENGLTFGSDEEWTYWPESVSRAAEGMLTGRNLVANHPKEVMAEDVIGEITDETYIDGVGLSWEGEVDNRERAQQAYRGRLDASPYLYAEDGGEAELPSDAPAETRIASEVTAVRDIGLVADGAIADSEVSPGAHPGLEGSGEGTATALSQAFNSKLGESVNSGETEHVRMPENDPNEADEVADLREQVEALREENEDLSNQVSILRRPYVEVITRGTDLEPDDVNLSAEQLAERINSEDVDDDADAEDEPEAEAEGEDPEAEADADPEPEQATALSAAPLTASRGESPGRATALSAGEGQTQQADEDLPDEDLETLKEQRRILGPRVTDDYREELDRKIELLESN